MESSFDVGQIEQVLSPWVTLVTRRVQFPDDHQVQEYHSLKLADYAAVLAVTTDGKIPLVRQYRPAQRRVTLELPSGFVDPAEEPGRACCRTPGVWKTIFGDFLRTESIPPPLLSGSRKRASRLSGFPAWNYRP
jgi:hypothetical protein